MTLRRHLWVWLNHAALNVGVGTEALLHVVVPPQVDHSPSDMDILVRSNPIREFLIGVGLVRR